MEIFIHIGHGKTGSSAIQSFLAKNRDLLLKYGVNYPEHESFGKALENKISSGNGGLLLTNFKFKENEDKYLLSSESLYGRLKDKEVLAALIKKLPTKPILICYTRDFFDYYISSWGQSIKRGRIVESIDEHAIGFKGFLGILVRYIEWADELGYQLVIKNYSKHEDDLIQSFCSIFLDENSGFFQEADFDVGVVNRSLTHSEYKVQQLFNKFLPYKSSDFISDVLVEKLPLVESEASPIMESTYNLLLSRYIEDIDYINQYIESNEEVGVKVKGMVRPDKEVYEKAQYTFSEEQLKLLVESISNRIISLEEEKESVFNRETAWILRDIANKYEKNKPLELEDAYNLMQLGVKLYDEGKFMKRKLAEFKFRKNKNKN